METIESTVAGIINTGLNEFASEIELESASEYVTEHVINEAIKEFQIESITYYADLIDKDEGNNYGKLDKQLSKELLNMYDMNGKYLDKNKGDSVNGASEKSGKTVLEKQVSEKHKFTVEKSAIFDQVKINRFDEPSPHNFRSVFESRKNVEKQKLRDLEKLCDEKKVKENGFTEANGMWKAYRVVLQECQIQGGQNVKSRVKGHLGSFWGHLRSFRAILGSNGSHFGAKNSHFRPF